ncbi:MAG: hypothetical protein ACTHMD_09640 [Flavisolibacter sp.]
MQVDKLSQQKEKGPDKNFIQVALVTTAGSYPETGFETVPIHQKIEIFLKEAVKKLKIVSTDGWIAKVGPTKIRINESYIDNNLSGEVTIDYGPEAGGGGNE